MDQAFPVMLVIRNSKGEARWMEVRDYLKRQSDNGNRAVRQIAFEGERFDVVSIRRWRDKMLAPNVDRQIDQIITNRKLFNFGRKPRSLGACCSLVSPIA